MTIDQNTLEQLLSMLSAQQEAAEQGEQAQTEPIRQGTHFASLGFVAVGKGEAPSEGDVLHVPTKAGKTARVRVIEQIDTSPYNGEFGDWAFTYKRLKRGE